MRLISLKARVHVSLVALAALLFASLFVFSFVADRAGYSGLMLVTPNGRAAGRITPATAQRLRDEGLLLTYEISGYTTAQALNSRHSATLIGTNSAYLDVTGYHLISRDFFTQSAWEGHSRVAALNESAALAMFGSTNIYGLTMSIGGQTWTITGVIDDRQEDSLNIYIPSSVSGGYIRSLMILMGVQVNHAYVVNTLGGFGVREGEYNFLNLSRTAGISGERFSVAWKLTVCLALILLGIKLFSFMKKICLSCKQELGRYYPRELLVRQRAGISKAGVAVASLVGGIATTLNLLLQVLATTLRWQEISLPVWYPGADFAYMLERLRDVYTLSVWVFGAYLIAAFAAAVTIGGLMNTGS